MDERANGFVCTKEAFKGDVRIRLCSYKVANGDTCYCLEVAAHRVGQAKLLLLAGGLELQYATEYFEILDRGLRGYDWSAGECIIADET